MKFLIYSFLAYCILEILRIAYLPETNYPYIIFMGIDILMSLLILGEFWVFMHRNAAENSPELLFSSNISKIVAGVYLTNIAIILFITFIFLLDVSPFLFIQIFVLGSLWKTNKSSPISENIRRISFIFTVIYVSYILVTTKNVFLGFAMLPYICSWLYLQVILENKENLL